MLEFSVLHREAVDRVCEGDRAFEGDRGLGEEYNRVQALHIEGEANEGGDDGDDDQDEGEDDGDEEQPVPVAYASGSDGRSRNKRPDVAREVLAPTQRRKKVKSSNWEQTSPADGGPVDPELIPSYGGHVAGPIWREQPVAIAPLRDKRRERKKKYIFLSSVLNNKSPYARVQDTINAAFPIKFGEHNFKDFAHETASIGGSLEGVPSSNMSPRDLAIHLDMLEIPRNLGAVAPFGDEETNMLPTHINLGESDEDTIQSSDFVPSSIGKALQEQPPVAALQFHGVDLIRACQNQ
ncbi:hypothetical protein M9H77_17491 [Catharanthus roseus]|uniref:Uncharacterized protein n=1 Tax=Catharanthus roseus TaxID=4058 RepID=A0ACC0B4R1_CATRO|nr:hypothetical protein M9H77_17491 [Catharanthus roseus]